MTTSIENATQDVQTFKIPKWNFEVFEKKFESLVRKAKKLGCEEPTFKVIQEVDEFRTIDLGGDELGRPYAKRMKVRFIEIEISGPSVEVNGWDFVASIEHTEAGNAIKKVSGYEGDIPVSYREGNPTCDHCKTRRNRKDSFLVTDHNGNWMQVGRTCLGDFLGRDPKNLVFGLGFWSSIRDIQDEEWSFGGGYCPITVGFGEFITGVYHNVRKHGWLSKSAAYQLYSEEAIPTAQRAWCLTTPTMSVKDEAIRLSEYKTIKDEDREKAEKAIYWTRETLSSKDVAQRSDYEQNLFIALSKPSVDHKDSGIVASLVIGYNRSLEDEIKRQEFAKKSNEWIWEEGQRVKDVKLTLVKQRSVESDFGVSVLHMFEDEVGNSVQWWGSAPFDDGENEAEIGDTCQASWTVKKYNTYKERKQTQVFRPARKKVIKAEKKN